MPSDRAPTLELAVALIARPSVTPDDGGCQALLRERLAPLGFAFDVRVDNGVTNLWARRGSARPLVCLAGHTDVVPPGPREAWTSDPFVPVLRDGYLYGRGAADMKGSLAAFVTAVEALVAAHPGHGGSIAFAVTSDEEGSSIDGTARIVERLQAAGTAIDYCIVGEPSSEQKLGDVVKNGRRGTLSGTLTVNGVQGHVAYPQLARNPIHLAAPALAELAATRWDEGNEHFPATTFQVSNVHAGTGAGNVIPGRLDAMFNFRYAPVSTREGLASKLAAVLDRHGLDYDIAWTAHGEPFHTRKGRLVEVAAATIRELTGITPALSCAGGTSDGRYLARICPEVLEIGPVNATIHKVDERVKASDLETLAAIYRRLLERLLAAEA
ncbi:MAG: succinyl-diaminopimelate desuccinylase [Proteobacteria bacterium]|jgi:succinyl-diaminopimelate desuccinylase|nr:succinyl-diaminopimelate desuccinylase [Pseudomonadota bacterium]